MLVCVLLCKSVLIMILFIIINYQNNIFIKLRWDVENNLSLKNVVVSFQTLKTAIWRSCGTEKKHAARPGR